jgi:uncharacterized protein YgbK (DUF1537 family)
VVIFVTRLLIIADDFTGAVDTGVHFSSQGISTFITTDEKLGQRNLKTGTDVWVCITQSRHLPAEDAYKKVASVTRYALDEGIPYIYKKTDSTLRGNIGSELAAVVDTAKPCDLMFVPAFPKENRITLKGIQYVNGCKLAKSPFSKDPFDPVTLSHVGEIINQQTSTPLVMVAKSNYEELLLRSPTSDNIYIIDAETDDDIKKIGQILKNTGRLKFLAGCAGFAEILPSLLDLKSSCTANRLARSKILVVSGSINQVSIEQLQYVKKQKDFDLITLNPIQKLDGNYPDSDECDKLVNDIQESYNRGHHVAIEAVSYREQMNEANSYAKIKNIPKNEIHQRIALNIGKIVKKILNNMAIDYLVVFGGDTLQGIMAGLGGIGIVPKKEIVIGVVLANLLYGHSGIHIITKAGGFGELNVFEHIYQYIFNKESCEESS